MEEIQRLRELCANQAMKIKRLERETAILRKTLRDNGLDCPPPAVSTNLGDYSQDAHFDQDPETGARTERYPGRE